MAHRGDYPGEFQGGRLLGDEVTTQSGWEEPGEGRALSPTTSPKAPRGPKAWQPGHRAQTEALGMGVRMQAPPQWTLVGRSAAIGQRVMEARPRMVTTGLRLAT